MEKINTSHKLTISNIRLAVAHDDIEHFKSIFEQNSKKDLLRFCKKVDIYFLLFLPKSKHTNYQKREQMLNFLDSTEYVKPLFDNFSFANGYVNFVFMLENKTTNYFNFIHSYFNSHHFKYLIDSNNDNVMKDLFSFFNMALGDKHKKNSIEYHQLANSFLNSKFRKELLFYCLGETNSLVITLIQNNHMELVKNCFQEPNLFEKIKTKTSLMQHVSHIETFDYFINLLGKNSIYEQDSLYCHTVNDLAIIEKILTHYPPSNEKEKKLILSLLPNAVHFNDEKLLVLLMNYAEKTGENIFQHRFKSHSGSTENTLFNALYYLHKNQSLQYLCKHYKLELLTTPLEIQALYQKGFDNRISSSVNKKMINFLIKTKTINDECFEYSSYKNLRLIDYLTLRNQDYYLHYLTSKKAVNLDLNSSNLKPENYNLVYQKVFEKARLLREHNQLTHIIQNVETPKIKIKI